ncbi:MAG: ABC transporter ATP-binding protein [Planctomycetes bacterium]|nr:ABC transporter ATP-binding protein [Planctomycetota bacterium]
MGFLWPYFKVQLAAALMVVAFTFAAAGCDVGQAYLLQDLLNRVLLRGGDSEGEDLDAEWFEANSTPAGAVLAEQRLASVAATESSAGLLGLRVYSGRAAEDPAWTKDALCRLLERSRRVLVADAADLREDDVEPRKTLAKAIRVQAAAGQLVLPDPRVATPDARAAAAALSLQARTLVREASFASALRVLKRIVVYAFALAGILAFLRYALNATSRVIVARVFFEMQCAAVSKSLELSAPQLANMRRGDLLARLNSDVAKCVNGIILPLATIYVLQPARLVVLYLGALYISWPLALALLVMAVTVLIPIRISGRTIRRSARDRQSALADVIESMHQMFAGIRLVKAFRREAHEAEKFHLGTERAYHAELGVIRARTASRSWLRLMNDSTVPVLILVGGWMIVNHAGGLDAGRFAAFAGLVMLMYRPTKSMAMAYNNVQDALPSYRRLRDLFDLESLTIDPPGATALESLREGIELRDVHFSYDGETPVLQGISFEAARGSTTALVGHTGSGKSTLMDILARHMDADSGEVLIDGQSITSLQRASWLSRVAVVSQQPFVFNDTLRENVRYGRLEATDAEVEEAARAACLHDEVAALPGGYGYVAGERGSQLSGGQIQRLTLARAFVRRPEVLLLDEAMSALDATTERLVQEAVETVSQDCTTLVIAHRLSTVRHADQILVLDQGRIVERGRHEDLLAAGGRYAELVNRMTESSADTEG